MIDLTKREIKRKIQAHEYSWKHGESDHERRIQAEIEAENYHKLLRMIISHDYKAAYEWIEQNYW